MKGVRLKYLNSVRTVLLRAPDTTVEVIRGLYGESFSFAEMNAEAHAEQQDEYECPQVDPVWGLDRVDGPIDGSYSGASQCSAVCGMWGGGSAHMRTAGGC